MPNIPYHDEPLPDISKHWVCINHIVAQSLEGMCSGPDAVCDLDEVLRSGLLRSRIQMGCERKRVTPSEWAAVYQPVWLDTSEGWLIEIAMRDTGAFLVATCYIWKPDWDRIRTTDPVGVSVEPFQAGTERPGLEREAVEEPPKLPSGNGGYPQPDPVKKIKLRHVEWPEIEKYGASVVETCGRWPNANIAASKILKKRKDLTIDHGTLRKGILKNFRHWIGVESKG